MTRIVVAGHRLKKIFRPVNPLDEKNREETDQHTKWDEGYEPQHTLKRCLRFLQCRNIECRRQAKCSATDVRCHYRCDAKGHQCAAVRGGKHQFDCKHDTSNRSIESGSNPARGTARNECNTLGNATTDCHAQHRPECRANLDDRPFPSHRSTGANGEGGGQNLHASNARPNLALLIMNRIHHLRYTVTFGFRGPILYKESDDEPSNNRRCDDQRHRELVRREGVFVRVVEDWIFGELLLHEEHVVHQPNQLAKNPGPTTCCQPYCCCKSKHCSLRQLTQPFVGLVQRSGWSHQLPNNFPQNKPTNRSNDCTQDRY
mmetsp:Transcript_68895/g.114491  ORF Transcript_68895/g.114491 Transcript_68895/m.114491 type:complete len:316 (+) Transcript_68895:244-1191(+)